MNFGIQRRTQLFWLAQTWHDMNGMNFKHFFHGKYMFIKQRCFLNLSHNPISLIYPLKMVIFQFAMLVYQRVIHQPSPMLPWLVTILKVSGLRRPGKPGTIWNHPTMCQSLILGNEHLLSPKHMVL